MSDEGAKVGLKAAVDDLMAVAHELCEAELQLPLPILAIEPAPDEGAVGEPGAVPEARGPGRPPGAKNKRTEEWRDFILTRYRSPLQAMAEMYSRPVDQLAAELKCDRLEAFKLQLAAAKELAPYLHQKMPVAIQVDKTQVVNLILETAGEAGAALPSGDDPSVIDVTFTEEKDDEKSDT